MEKNISVIGGDLRIVKLIEMLKKDGYKIFTYGLETADSINDNENVVMCNSLEEAVQNSNIVVGPIPLSSNKEDINTPFSDKKVSINKLMELLNDKLFIAGNIDMDIKNNESNKNIKIIDLLEREELAVLNTISTAEGALKIAIEETITTIHGSKVLVMGFGRIGKIMAKMLDGIGARVSCEARKNSDLAWIKAYGYKPVSLNDLSEYLPEYDIIINTIPSLILDSEKLDYVKQECLIIDLASNPGGVDKMEAKMRGIKTIWALSLPGKIAPLTSAEFIKETIYNILKEA